MSELEIVAFEASYREAVLELTVAAWTPVFEHTQHDVPRFVYDAFYPDGWEIRQKAEIGALLDSEPQNFWLALAGGRLAGFIGIRIHDEDQMGEIHVIAVSPADQRQGIGNQLMRFAEKHIRDAGMKMIMVETIGDTGHAPARRSYEAFGFVPWPVARYFKPI